MVNHRAYSYKIELLSRELAALKLRVKKLETTLQHVYDPKPFSTSDFINLPDYLRKTYLAIANRGESNASTIATLTKRKRAAESGNLNELVRLGWLGKRCVVGNKTGGAPVLFFVLREAKEALTALA